MSAAEAAGLGYDEIATLEPAWESRVEPGAGIGPSADYIDLRVARRFTAAANDILDTAIAGWRDQRAPASTRAAVYAAFMQACAARNVVALLRQGEPAAGFRPVSLSLDELARVTGLAAERLQAACAALVDEGVIDPQTERSWRFAARVEDAIACIDAHAGAWDA